MGGFEWLSLGYVISLFVLLLRMTESGGIVARSFASLLGALASYGGSFCAANTILLVLSPPSEGEGFLQLLSGAGALVAIVCGAVAGITARLKRIDVKKPLFRAFLPSVVIGTILLIYISRYPSFNWW